MTCSCKKSAYVSALLFLTFLLFNLPLFAGEFDTSVTVLGQSRENERLQSEVPINGYWGLTLNKPEWKMSSEANMRFFRDFAQSLDDYDLYQAVVHINALEKLQIDLGRQFVNEGFFAEVLDGIQVFVRPDGYFDFTAYAGVPRSVEIGDFNKDDGFLTGFSVGLKNVERTQAQLHLAWRKNDIEINNQKENDEIFFGFNLSHQLNTKAKPLFYGLFEYNASGKVVETITAGLDIYPFKRFSFNTEFDYFNANRAADKRSVLGLFAAGPVISGRFASTITLIPDVLDFVQSYAYQNIEVVNGDRRHGHLLEAAFPIFFDQIGLSIEPGYYFAKSFGGRLHGVRAFIHEQFTKKFYSELSFDYVTYKKITNNNDNAFSAILWAGYEVAKNLTLSAGMEYNNNNLFDKDVRGSFKLDYVFGHKI